ncbi:MAG: hypothetical protein ACRD3W_02880 [Terriglobales bacterium]
MQLPHDDTLIDSRKAYTAACCISMQELTREAWGELAAGLLNDGGAYIWHGHKLMFGDGPAHDSDN